jgi:hypothetical protein
VLAFGTSALKDEPRVLRSDLASISNMLLEGGDLGESSRFSWSGGISFADGSLVIAIDPCASIIMVLPSAASTAVVVWLVAANCPGKGSAALCS